MAGVMTLGMVRAARDGPMDYPRPSPNESLITHWLVRLSMDAVQRPNGDGGAQAGSGRLSRS